MKEFFDYIRNHEEFNKDQKEVGLAILPDLLGEFMKEVPKAELELIPISNGVQVRKDETDFFVYCNKTIYDIVPASSPNLCFLYCSHTWENKERLFEAYINDRNQLYYFTQYKELSSAEKDTEVLTKGPSKDFWRTVKIIANHKFWGDFKGKNV